MRARRKMCECCIVCFVTHRSLLCTKHGNFQKAIPNEMKKHGETFFVTNDETVHVTLFELEINDSSIINVLAYRGVTEHNFRTTQVVSGGRLLFQKI